MTTAREDLLGMIFPVRHLDKKNRKLVEEGVDRLLAKHAHELAEKQRQKLIDDGHDGPCACGGCSWCLAQDYIGLIDPQKET